MIKFSLHCCAIVSANSYLYFLDLVETSRSSRLQLQAVQRRMLQQP